MPREPKNLDKVTTSGTSPDPAVSIDPEAEFGRLEAEVTALEHGNEALRQRLAEGYVQLLRVVDASHPLHTQAVARMRELRALRPVATEVGEPTREAVDIEAVIVAAKIAELVSVDELGRSVAWFNALPAKLQEGFAKRFSELVTKPTETVRITSFRALNFEMSRLIRVQEQGLETVDTTTIMDSVTVDYDGYDRNEVVFDAAHQHVPKKGSEIDFDVPISRDGVPYSYEVKSYSRKRYGHDAAARNQLLKYQTAIEQGKISGATVEVRGRIDPEFINWLMGTAIDDRGFVPDVEVVYTVELPTGREYRFVLKRSESGQGLKFHNEEKYSDEELVLIRGLQHSLIDKSIRGVLADTHIEPEASHAAFAETFDQTGLVVAGEIDPAVLARNLTELFGLPGTSTERSGVIRELLDNVHDQTLLLKIWATLLGPVPADIAALPTAKLAERLRKSLRQFDFTDAKVFDLCSAIVGYNITEQPQQGLRDLWDFTLADPGRISSAKVFTVYEGLRTESILGKVRASEQRAKINSENKAAATSELANEVYVERLIREYQEFLAQNPALAAVKRQYVISHDQIPAAVARTMVTIERVRSFELARQASGDETTAQAQRRVLGYDGRPEGVALDIEHIAIDALFSMNAEGLPRTDVESVLKGATNTFFDQLADGRVKVKWRSMDEFQAALADQTELRKAYEGLSRKYRDQLDIWLKSAAFVRSYEWPERFITAEQLPEYLADKDRRYQEIHIYDPVSGKSERHANTNEEAIKKTEALLVKENIDRAKAHLVGTDRAGQYKRRITGAEGAIRELESQRDAAIGVAQKSAEATLAALGRRQGELSAERKRLQQPTPDADTTARLLAIDQELAAIPEQRRQAFDAVRAISAEYMSPIQQVQRGLEELYKLAIPKAEWKTIARDIIHRQDDNIMKLIYAVTANGDIIVQEEVLRAQVTGRAAHSELAQGRNTYGAGELAFEKQNGVWALIEINNGSGHYRPDADNTLHYVKSLLAKKGMDVSKAQTIDCILRGRPLREATAF